MEQRHIAVTLVLSILVAGLLAMPFSGSGAAGRLAPASSPAPSSAPGSISSFAQTAQPVPLTGFPRTVLVETFTAVWCIHCPAESQALYALDQNTSHNVLSIAELHVCASTTVCLENYVPPDGTSNARGAFYSVCGFPDVFFDGLYPACGATNSMTQMQSEYDARIANASAVPGNVSIAQTAAIGSGTVSGQAYISSAITGSYNAITYLMEYIGKVNVSNGYGPHDLGNVVRETLFNHPVNLVAGSTTEFNMSGELNTTWNTQNLSVVTFVQQNSTKIIENANMAPVSTVSAAVTSNPGTVFVGAGSSVSVHVTNVTTLSPIAGATVELTSTVGGTFSPTTGVTAANGTYTATYSPPTVSSDESAWITATISLGGKELGSAIVGIMISPLSPPSQPLDLTLAPGIQQVTLSWMPPASGGSGVTYHVYRSTSASGGYTLVGTVSTTSFTDTELAMGQSYWYEVNAHGTAGFSHNSSVLSAIAVTAIASGLPSIDGWWLTMDQVTFHANGSGSLNLHLAPGTYAYQVGSQVNDFLAAQPYGNLTLADLSDQLTLAFLPNYATFAGTVSPSGATVILNGSVIPAPGGSFSVKWAAGAYTLVVSMSGFTTDTSQVTLTPGNTTTRNIQLQRAGPSGGSTPSNGGLSETEVGVVLAVVAAVVGVAAIVGGMTLSKRRRMNQPPREGPDGSQSSPPPPSA